MSAPPVHPGRGPAMAVALGLLAPLALAACDDTEFKSVGGGPVEGEGYEAVVEVFDGNCLACHSAGAKLGSLDLETDPCGALVGVSAANAEYGGALLVDPGNSSGSVLWHKVADTGTYGDVMPTSGAMDQANIDIIAAWIDDGASCDSGGGSGGGESGGGDDTGGSGTDDTGEPSTWQGDYSWANVQNEVFSASCTGCHVDGGIYADLQLTSDVAYASIVSQPSTQGSNYVEPGEPESSYLYLKMTDDPSIAGSVMPTGGELDPQYLDLVRGWIAAGANE